ncbi:PelD GGDEF domain-containing protein [Rhodanobacter sp. AS-Z3]|uniref:PelD GGDEF domain-containing protein n=1 Tax=Rhodanobacter sp. AS-Z3 TaxID=3031330 RepID=UPI0024787BB7|nr:PelD GGDEF domain-containing protein [Rhodanobacter sp. AS-Z3]WEN15822.1 PelD GGDEF domain-containing protein [Rhodanobacter sp. AS-Z3]
MDPQRSVILKKSIESVALPLLMLALLYLWGDVRFNYPWWWLAPLAIALRYGLAYGIGAGLVVVFGNFAEIWLLGLTREQPGGEIIGGLIATYLAGLYTTHAQSRLVEANSSLEYLEQRLESLTRVFYVTRLSHSRLEENLLTKSYDLRSALDAIARELATFGPIKERLPQAPLQHVLQLLAYYGRLGTCGVYQVIDNRVSPEPLAFHGLRFSLELADPLITCVVENQRLAYYSVDQILAGETSAYRVVLPMTAADDTMLAVVVVQDLPLLAVEEENLLTLAAMTAFMADAMRAGQLSHAVRQVVPTCPVEFALEWFRLGHLRHVAGVHSSWVLLLPGAQAAADVVDTVLATRRGLDQYWRSPLASAQSGLLILLALSGEGPTQGFLQRINTMCREQLGGDLQQLGWVVQLGQVERGSGAELLQLIEPEG